MKNVKQANINVSLKQLFFRWLDVTKSFHNLANQQQQVLALLLYHHYKLSKQITNEKILWKAVFDYDTKQLIEDELGISNQGLQNNLTKLRKKNIIKDNKILSRYVPKLEKDSKNFKVIFNFNIVDEEG